MKINLPKFEKQRFILSIGDDGAILVYMDGNNVRRRLFASSAQPENLQPFNELLAIDTDAPLYILVDVMDQNYVPYTLPPVSPISVQKLVQKRLDRDFAADDIKGALSLGRASDGRKDWNFLFIALPNIPPLSQWVEFAVELPNPLQGIYLLPVEGEYFIDALHKARTCDNPCEPAEWQLLVTHNKIGGFRQIVLKNGTLVFTRLTQPVGEAVPEVIAGNVEQEIANTVEYLKRLSFSNPENLEVIIIASQDIRQALSTSNILAGDTAVLTPHEAALLLDIEEATEPSDHFGDVVMATHFGLHKKKKLKLHTAYSKKLETLNKACNWSRVATIGIGAIMLIMYIMALLDIQELSKDVDYAQKVKSTAEQQLDQVSTNTSELPLDIDRINDVVALYEVLSEGENNPLPMVAKFGQTMGEDILVKSLKWESRRFLEDQKNSDLPEVNATFETEFTREHKSLDDFLLEANQFFDQLHKQFPNYKVTYSKLPGTTQDDEALEVNFNEIEKIPQRISEGGITVHVTIQGPVNSEEQTTPTKG